MIGAAAGAHDNAIAASYFSRHCLLGRIVGPIGDDIFAGLVVGPIVVDVISLGRRDAGSHETRGYRHILGESRFDIAGDRRPLRGDNEDGGGRTRCGWGGCDSPRRSNSRVVLLLLLLCAGAWAAFASLTTSRLFRRR